MEQYFILVRTVTYAQRMEKVLTRAGVRCQIFRAPRELTESGCAYTVRVVTGDIVTVLYMLRRESLNPEKIFLFQNNFYREVVL